ncbi:urease subunit beta [Parageobacillus thermoglucosidasius]|uniref:Urease subunit beta n=1 Tax=Parageobacillus thermoglucosidasius TaxID=1426 RepID=A0AB38R2G0_PARTM|nr:urease subunit beta [Parageobacillus thermoglucosidasius]AEH48232.1 Urease subunit beta [Parageobacillus thermoglucosidasius C56-YS93]RDE26879.1 urease subunit beta [Parageobacillus thermoglucosidasius]UOE78127.1 urease subunit beta [Parageobacillus thermoglucosidasius]BDG32429.1 urease subunit beta [Parageobacillus thermoglucosidasius]GCD82905.1 urease subunit beta [Parageobacillus thermoglucosidasius]
MIPGEYWLKQEAIVCNQHKPITKIVVKNRGDRPIQVGSHFHFFEVNSFLEFDRQAAYGKHLNIPAGTAVRFEPGDAKQVELVPFSGERHVYGLNNFVNGPLDRGKKGE